LNILANNHKRKENPDALETLESLIV
jgi:hypothetical protein